MKQLLLTKDVEIQKLKKNPYLLRGNLKNVEIKTYLSEVIRL